MVRLKYAGDGLAYFDVFTFTERLEEGCRDEFCRTVRRGREAAERDRCKELAKNGEKDKCSPDSHVYREDGQHTNARLFFALPEHRPVRPWKGPQ